MIELLLNNHLKIGFIQLYYFINLIQNLINGKIQLSNQI
jgi:hypothetical protein